MVVRKKELVRRVSYQTGLRIDQTSEVVEQLILEITDSLSAGDEVVFRNFGKFETAFNQPKIGRNPLNPEHDIVIPKRRVAKFRVGKELKKRIEQ